MRRKEILLCQQNRELALKLESQLEWCGFTVVAIVQNCKDARELAAELKPDLAIIDAQIVGSDDVVAYLVGILNVHCIYSTELEMHERSSIDFYALSVALFQ